MPYYGEIYGGIDPNEVEGFQVGLINTPHRVDVYLDAYQDIGITDKVICDLGAGSGLLGLEALRLGARKLYLVEINSKAVEYLKAIVAAHEYSDRITIINKDICELSRSDFAEPVDVFVSETLSGLGCYNEGIIHYMNHIHNLFPKANLIPTGIETTLKFVDPIYTDKYFWPQYDHQPALLEGFKIHNHKTKLSQDSDECYAKVARETKPTKSMLTWSPDSECLESFYTTEQSYTDVIVMLDHTVTYSPGVVKNWSRDMWYYNKIDQGTPIELFLHDKCELVMYLD